MPEFEVTVDFEVFCRTCGKGLCNMSSTGRSPGRGMYYVQVEPCDTCMENAKDKGYVSGYDAGYDDGHDDGCTQGAAMSNVDR